MADDETFITKNRDFSDIAKLQDPIVFQEFLEQPLTFIAETITGALAVGPWGVAAAGGRIVQGLLKARLFRQWAAEFKYLRDKGRIPDDFAGKKYGFQTWVELMRIIDEESPDADRLDALKAMFFAVNKVNVTDGERIAAYQLWQIAKQLSSGELLLLKTVYEQRMKYPQQWFSYSQWVSHMTNASGHGITGLIDVHEKRLVEFCLLSPRKPQPPDGSEIDAQNARLTDLGFRFCTNIPNYQIEMSDVASSG